MRIPFWQREQAHPTQAIDRLREHRSTRRVMGIHLNEDLSRLHGSLLQVRGSGKHARFRELAACESKLEDSACEQIRKLSESQSPALADVRFVSDELASYQTGVYHQLTAAVGLERSDLAIISLLDPGFGYKDFEGTVGWNAFSDALAVAKLTGVTVVDRFADRDRADGGNGQHLTALGFWFLLGDRNPKIAEENRLLLLCRHSGLVGYFLPASDGLDAVLPDIQVFEIQPERSAEKAEGSQNLSDLIRDLLQRFPDLGLRVVQGDPKVEQWIQGLDTGQFESQNVAMDPIEVFGFSSGSIDAAATAFLGNSFIDQLPASIPGITGNGNPRVLGSLTPGSLVNFRQCILEASKVSPSIMKLRDAI